MIKKAVISSIICLSFAQVIAQEDCCEMPASDAFVIPGDPIDPCCINAGYPYPASITPSCAWNLYAKGEFLYLGSTIDVGVPAAQRFTPLTLNFQIDRTTENFLQSDRYRPGFRISLGMNLDSVILDATYLRYHAHTTAHFRAGDNGGIAITQMAQSILNFNPVLFSDVKSSQHINADTLLVSLQRPVYIGKRIIMNLNYGLLTYWAGQKTRFECAALDAPPIGVRTSDGFAFASHKSWAVGPNLGFKAIGLLAYNLSAIVGIDLALQYGYMYKGIEVISFPNAPFSADNTTLKRGKAPHLQTAHNGEIGIGWGNYFACNKFHLGLTLSYVWFFQHIFAYGIPYSSTAVDAFFFSFGMHGIAIGGQLDF